MTTLTTSPVLVMKQLTSTTRCDFDILDGTGAVVGAVVTQGGALGRFLTGPRQLTVSDRDGSPYVHVDDAPNFGRDRYDLVAPDGARIGRITKEFTFFRKRLTVEVAGGRSYEMNERDLMDREFDISGPGGRLVSVRRAWPGIIDSLLSRSTYVVAFEADEDPVLRRAALGAVIALELIRLKARKNSGATTTMM
ncbi:MAG: hypothetical protein V9G12_08430 [Microthrixaceae bacterium]|jgi:uncharacterized protein YxjI